MSENRRELATRKYKFFHKFAETLVKSGLTPNQVSVLSTFFAAGSAYFFSQAFRSDCFYSCVFTAVVCVQLRLLCNMLDGLMAVESGKKTKTGELFNDFPDRVSDALTLIGLGYGIESVFSYGVTAGWLAALLAVMTAYTRVLGASMGTGHFFAGPMAKQHRMAVVTIGSLAWMLEFKLNGSSNLIVATILLIIVGSALTCANRLRLITKKLNSGS